ncbi:nitroreductase [Desulfosporosinus sp. PR]|uniref:nitroreductase n=1 Tax=Candidatus Desulfosporosinus nitrosoreducens TaxID=3401928 RepID=UPI0027E8D504|nr:nitroreductase [Desulfosporosinus sp. PR]MDQ7095104.1 nitroreductase [Desulfosporosinus sp. PR]
MIVSEALQIRRSCRAFKPDPVDRDTLLAVLGAALCTPSWANSQPWELFVAGGDVLKEINQAYLENQRKGVQPSPDLPRPKNWPASINARRQELFSGLSLAAGEAAKQFGELNQKFFHAPAVIYLGMDKSLTTWSVFDLGAISQSIMLAAVERGLATIPAVTLVHYPEVLRGKLGIPDNFSLVLGIAIGYEDKEHLINNFKSTRRPLAEAVSIKGLE